MPKLDRRSINTLPGPDAGRFDVVHWDNDLSGLGLRVLESGTRSWVVRYRVGRRQRVITLGKSVMLSPAQARAKAGEILARAKLGQDSQAEIQTQKAGAEATLGGLLGTYITQYVERQQKPRTQAETKRHLLRDWKPLHQTVLSNITRQSLAQQLGKLEQESGPVARNRARASLSRLFTWAMQEGLAERNPVIETGKRPEHARDRVLTLEESRAIWSATEQSGDHNAIVRLLMLTGQRRQEVGAMAWGELDLDAALWTIPGDRTKNKRTHEVPLSEQVLVILAGVAMRPHRDLVFGEGSGPFSGWSQSKARLDRRSGVMQWTLHDLRRTVVTGMAEIGVQPHVIEAIVNHVSGHKAGVAGIYNRATYAVEKRAALQTWANHLEETIASAGD